MPRTRPRPATSRASALAAGGTAGLVGMLSGHGVTAVAIIAAAVVLSILIVTVIPEWYWLRALNQPGQDLNRLLDRLEHDRLASVDDVARLAATLQAAHETLLQSLRRRDCTAHDTRPSSEASCTCQ